MRKRGNDFWSDLDVPEKVLDTDDPKDSSGDVQKTLEAVTVVCSLGSFSLYALHSEISLTGLDRRPLSQKALSTVSFLELCAIWLQKKRLLPHTLFGDGKSTLIWCDRYEDRMDSVYGYLVGFHVLKHVETIY